MLLVLTGMLRRRGLRFPVPGGEALGEEFLNVPLNPQRHPAAHGQKPAGAYWHLPAQIDYYAVSRGPAPLPAAHRHRRHQGAGLPDNTPCIGVSTPEAIAYGLLGFEGLLSP